LAEMNIAWSILPPSGKDDSSNRRFVSLASFAKAEK